MNAFRQDIYVHPASFQERKTINLNKRIDDRMKTTLNRYQIEYNKHCKTIVRERNKFITEHQEVLPYIQEKRLLYRKSVEKPCLRSISPSQLSKHGHSFLQSTVNCQRKKGLIHANLVEALNPIQNKKINSSPEKTAKALERWKLIKKNLVYLTSTESNQKPLAKKFEVLYNELRQCRYLRRSCTEENKTQLIEKHVEKKCTCMVCTLQKRKKSSVYMVQRKHN